MIGGSFIFPLLLYWRFSLVSAVFLENKSSILMALVQVYVHVMIQASVCCSGGEYVSTPPGWSYSVYPPFGMHSLKKRRNEFVCMRKSDRIQIICLGALKFDRRGSLCFAQVSARVVSSTPLLIARWTYIILVFF